MWAIHNPSSKLVHSDFNLQNDFDFEDFKLFVISENKLYILKENSEKWFFFFQKEGIVKTQEDEYLDNSNDGSSEESADKDAEQLKKTSKEKKEKENAEKILIKIQMAQKVQNTLFDTIATYDMKNISSVSFDQGPIPIISLKFGSLLFF